MKTTPTTIKTFNFKARNLMTTSIILKLLLVGTIALEGAISRSSTKTSYKKTKKIETKENICSFLHE
jgi:hypothetical protein